MDKTLTRLLLIFVGCFGLALGCRAATPRPEHPFPQMVRGEWLNLNGEWEFAETDDSADESFLNDKAYPDKITVPFCRESKLSGLQRKGFVKNVWYRRAFETPKMWRSSRVLLHIGACDWKTRVWVNGQLVGQHNGGSAPITCEVTQQLKAGRNVVIVHAFDDIHSGNQALGKQSSQLESNGCVYTRTTGIWQTVWLEGVGTSYIKDCKIEPDAAGSRALLQAEIDGPCRGLVVKAVAYAGNKVVGSAQTPADWRNSRLVLNLSNKRLWSLKDPFLYDLKLLIIKNGKVIDSVSSYFGLRSVSIKGAAILINGKPVFQRTVLDQGFYPDGVWTAPSDSELRADVERSLAVGFNGARLHQKVFEPRFIYWADKLGYLLWGEYPNWGMSHTRGEAVLPMIAEWTEIVRRDRNHPAIIGWCPFNETGGDSGLLQNTVATLTRTLDPSRPLIDVSGFTHSLPDAEVMDAHDYNQDPVSFRGRYMNALATGEALPMRYGGNSTSKLTPFFVSEYGGIGWAPDGGGWGYGVGPKAVDEFYARYKGLTDAQLDNKYMFGFCYTQLYDVEQERNGLYTYDRKPKFDVKKLHTINSRIAECEKNPVLEAVVAQHVNWSVIVGAAPDGDMCREWSYTIDKPADEWVNSGFDDSAWQKGRAGFGQKGGWEDRTRTPWNTSDIWLRQWFDFNGSAFDRAMLAIHYDNGTEVYLNGAKIWSAGGWNDNYGGFDVSKSVRKAIKPGQNLIAVHCHQDAGGQFIDLALLVGNK